MESKHRKNVQAICGYAGGRTFGVLRPNPNISPASMQLETAYMKRYWTGLHVLLRLD
ncbi:hypothetical protein P152DRAFT_455142 [Eremomyces bilateralis CBS 781.70]|uniref:Uncharacterized protein n=1 Tax=Eremomyces bilateralis CBS 781.70 TaxID=1392243 RepID=A0A6G1GBH8_9PEZI|nr:uncharacterized protein P152DRAFT_455142 [Eremomyces bilateralis CBS 781.70]KAF1815435.1 hypothetical protein P152DRAFT_455142 [Eremomyces bilateralis CBS 781.70]